MGAEFDLTHYPVILVKFPSAGNDAEIHAWYDTVEKLLDEAEGPIAFLDDIRALELTTTTAGQRRIAAARHVRLAEGFADKHAGNARFVSGPIALAVLRVFDWLSPVPWPLAVFQDFDEALAWCRARVEAAKEHPGYRAKASGHD